MPSQASDLAAAPTLSRLEYDVVDVFTDRAFAGNPLAVVYGADGLTTEQLQAITSEFNLSETAFPVSLTGTDRDASVDYRVRIFTPGGEIPFAGHPTLGTAWSLSQRGRLLPGNRRQACGAGPIDVHVPDDPLAPVELCARPRDLATELSAEAVAAVVTSVGLGVDDLVGPVYAAGCGITFVHLPVSPGVVAAARPGLKPLTGVLAEAQPAAALELMDPLEGVNVFAVIGDETSQHVANEPPREEAAPTGARSAVATAVEPGIAINARVFVPGLSIPEDPATGAAAAGLGIALCGLGLAAPNGQTRYRITQGVDMGRPSVLLGRVEALDGRPVACRVAGQVRPVASGTIAVPMA